VRLRFGVVDWNRSAASASRARLRAACGAVPRHRAEDRRERACSSRAREGQARAEECRDRDEARIDEPRERAAREPNSRIAGLKTPNLDKLAANGLRFTQFYNTAKCHSSRVSLLSGRWCRQAGDTTLNRAVILPEVLAPAGYFTGMTGKWHLDKEPTDFGFQRYFGHLSGATNYYLGDKTFRLNGEKWTVPDQDFYTTIANVDYALKFIGEARGTKKPWMTYIAFNDFHHFIMYHHW
jgi:arylsulfatase A-like enzyme